MVLEIVSTVAVFGGNIFLGRNLKLAVAMLIVCNLAYTAICWNNPILRAQNIILALIGITNFVKLSIRKTRCAEENNN